MSRLDHFSNSENFFVNNTFASFACWTRWFCILSFPWLRRIRHFRYNLLFWVFVCSFLLGSLYVSLLMQIIYGGIKSGVTLAGVTQGEFLESLSLSEKLVALFYSTVDLMGSIWAPNPLFFLVPSDFLSSHYFAFLRLII